MFSLLKPKSTVGEDDQEVVFEPAVEDLRSLIIYAKATSIKPWDWRQQKATSVTQMFSFGEPTAIKLCTQCSRGAFVFLISTALKLFLFKNTCQRTEHQANFIVLAVTDMLACTERQLVRTYPRGTRFDSSNYDPLPMWRSGIQMAAMNFQYPDVSMHLNQGFFRQNGGCGYILKPAVMRREDPGGGSTPFDPNMETPHPDVPAVDFEIEVCDGMNIVVT